MNDALTAIQSFLNACRVVLLDEDIEEQAIRLRRSGMIKLPDAIIAATALLRNVWNGLKITILFRLSGLLNRLDKVPKLCVRNIQT